MDGEKLREGIFALHTRRFGSVAEVLIKRLVKLGKAKNQFHDLYDDFSNKRVEVKFSRVLKKSAIPVCEETVLQCIEAATIEQRVIAWKDRKRFSYDCNIQQVKRREFDELYYGLFFLDCVVIFNIEATAIGSQVYYSDKQHKGNVGEGQFHISEKTIHIHETDYFYKKISYSKLYDLLK